MKTVIVVVSPLPEIRRLSQFVLFSRASENTRYLSLLTHLQDRVGLLGKVLQVLHGAVHGSGGLRGTLRNKSSGGTE